MRKDRDALLHNIGKRLCETRKLQGISQAGLAEKADLSVVYISNIEAGKKNISADVLLRLCSALNIPSDFLLRADLARRVQLTYGIDTIFTNCSEEEIESIADFKTLIRQYVQASLHIVLFLGLIIKEKRTITENRKLRNCWVNTYRCSRIAP